MTTETVIPVIFAVFALCIINYAKKSRCGLKILALNAASGIAALYFGKIFVKTVYISFEINALSLAFSIVFGIPGACFSAMLSALQNL